MKNLCEIVCKDLENCFIAIWNDLLEHVSVYCLEYSDVIEESAESELSLFCKIAYRRSYINAGYNNKGIECAEVSCISEKKLGDIFEFNELKNNSWCINRPTDNQKKLVITTINKLDNHITEIYSINTTALKDGNAYFIALGVDKNFFHANISALKGYAEAPYINFSSLVGRLILCICDKNMDIPISGFDKTVTSLVFMDYSSIINYAVRDITLVNLGIKYELLNELSALTYESVYSKGKIVFCNKDELELLNDIIIRFSNALPFTKNNLKIIRKLLEMTNDGSALIIEKGEKINEVLIVGISNYDKLRDKIPNYCIVIFEGKSRWSLVCGGKKILLRDEWGYSDPNLIDIQKEKWKGDINDYFKIHEGDIFNLLNTAIQQKHGTLIIIFEDDEMAKKEAERLVMLNRGISFSKVCTYNMLESFISGITSIDGAIIVGLSGNVYAFGCILDGKSEVLGNAARGARYNSAITYLNSLENVGKVAACIVSEDGMINVEIPNND